MVVDVPAPMVIDEGEASREAAELQPVIDQPPGPADPSAAMTASGRSRRNYRLPKRFQDILPEPLISAMPVAKSLPVAASPPVSAPSSTHEWNHL
jgi:hypothetical protein